jgi:long-chain acyl-CoA synthetase
VDLSQAILGALEEAPHEPAVWFEGDWWQRSYLLRVSQAIERAGRKVQGAGEDPISVGVLLRNRPAQLALMVGVIANHDRLVTLNALAPDRSLAEDIKRSRPSILIAEADDFGRSGIVDVASEVGSLCLAINRSDPGDLTPIAEQPELKEIPPTGEISDVAIEMSTSGTTGPPKRIFLTYSDLERSMSSTGLQIRGGTRSGRNRNPGPVIVANPLAHISGSWYVVQAVLEKRHIVLLDRFETTRWAAAVREFNPRVASLPPTAMRMVIDADIPKKDLESLRAVTSGTAPLPRDLQRTFEERYSIPVLPQYGATEFAGPVVGWSLADHGQYREQKRGSVGRAYPGVAIRVVDERTLQDVPPDQVGLLEVRKTEESGEGSSWVRTTDLASLDDDGFLWIRGRADDAINRGGFKFSARQVAEVLERHPAVEEATVVGVADTRLGETPAAAIVLRDADASTFDSASLLAWSRQSLKPYEVPAQILIVDQLPRTSSGKVSAHQVRALFREG